MRRFHFELTIKYDVEAETEADAVGDIAKLISQDYIEYIDDGELVELEEAVKQLARIEKLKGCAYGKEIPVIDLLSKLTDKELQILFDDLSETMLQEGRVGSKV